MAVIDNTIPPSQSGIAGIPAFPGGARTITPSDADTFVKAVAVYVGTAGDVRVLPANGDAAVTFKAVPAGGMVQCSVRGVLSTGTTASDLVGIG